MPEKKSSFKKVIIKHFFDFFMLFLAVTLGFFVDNYRDAYDEQKTAHGLADNLVNDIAADTINIHKLLLACNLKLRMLDSLYQLIDDENRIFNDSLIYYYSAYVASTKWFERSNSTYEQITNSGYLRYFDKDVGMNLTKYNLSCEKTFSLLENERTVLAQKIYPFEQQIFHTEIFSSILKDQPLPEKPVLHNWNKDTQWLYHNYITEMRMINKSIATQYIKLLKKGRATINVLKTEYEIK